MVPNPCCPPQTAISDVSWSSREGIFLFPSMAYHDSSFQGGARRTKPLLGELPRATSS